VIPTTLPAAALPRARTLTDALLSPAGPAPAPAALDALRARLAAGLAAVGPASGPVLRIDAFALRTATGADAGAAGRPFRWTPRTARRTLGVAAVRHCLVGGGRTPAEAVAASAARLVEDARHGLARRGTPAAWLASLPGGARAQVLAEATTWATHLYEAVEWHRLARPPAVGAPDRWWDCPGPVAVALRGRADARFPLPGGGEALLTMVAGRPGPSGRVELGLAALVDVVARPTARPPSRVVGWWPECGRALVLAVDLGLLSETAGSVTEAVRRAAGDRRPGPVHECAIEVPAAA
jgi:hypothetical protein